MAQLVEHILGKDEVTGSTPVSSSTGGKTPPFLLENGYCRFLSFMACGGKTLPYSRKRNVRFLILWQVFPYSQKAGFLRVLASLATIRIYM